MTKLQLEQKINDLNDEILAKTSDIEVLEKSVNDLSLIALSLSDTTMIMSDYLIKLCTKSESQILMEAHDARFNVTDIMSEIDNITSARY